MAASGYCYTENELEALSNGRNHYYLNRNWKIMFKLPIEATL